MRALLKSSGVLGVVGAGSLAACSIAVDSSALDSSGCPPNQRLCIDKCVDVTIPGHGCGSCVPCGEGELPDDGYAIYRCVAPTGSNSASAPSGHAEANTCEFVKCMPGFHGAGCNIPDNDFSAFEHCDRDCAGEGQCTALRPDVRVCL